MVPKQDLVRFNQIRTPAASNILPISPDISKKTDTSYLGMRYKKTLHEAWLYCLNLKEARVSGSKGCDIQLFWLEEEELLHMLYSVCIHPLYVLFFIYIYVLHSIYKFYSIRISYILYLSYILSICQMQLHRAKSEEKKQDPSLRLASLASSCPDKALERGETSLIVLFALLSLCSVFLKAFSL